MPGQDQSSIITYLKQQAATLASSESCAVVETHISVVILGGDRVFKLKRAIQLPYLDFSTAALRLAACQRELELNLRSAPEIYRAVRRITRQPDGKLAFDGDGELVDAVVEMARFDQDTLLDRMAHQGGLSPTMLIGLAQTVSSFHAQMATDRSRSGGQIMKQVLDINEQAFRSTNLFTADEVAALSAAMRAALDRHRLLLDARAANGRVRRCHGDLHLRNICLVDGQPTLFDCIEFDDDIATIDVLYDLAFLLMDLWHRDLAREANVIFNRYLDAGGESDGIPLLPFFMAVRAAVRAHVTATQAQAEAEADEALASAARSYVLLARRLLDPVPVVLLAIGGFSGTGKSSVAAALAHRFGPAPGARALSSDRIRKRLHGVSAEVRLPETAYRPEVSARVYATLMAEARAALAAGHAVVVEAVFDRVADRRAIEDVAAGLGVDFKGLWLHAPPEVLFARVEARRNDPSDATPAIVAAQLAREKSAVDWARVHTVGTPSAVVNRALQVLGLDEAVRSAGAL